jgi:hypothetical protein
MVAAARRVNIGETTEKLSVAAVITAVHFLIFAAVYWELRTPPAAETGGAVTYVTLLAPQPSAAPIAEPAQIQPAVDGLVNPVPIAITRVMPRLRRPVRTAIVVPKHRAAPCPPSPAPEDGRAVDPSCLPTIRIAPTPQLQLPGGLQQDAFGNLLTNPANSSTPLPPVSPDQRRADAASYEAAAVRLFGPPYAPAKLPWADDPAHHRERGPLIQFIRDRLNSAPLTPQSTLDAPLPTYDIPEWFPTSSIVQ